MKNSITKNNVSDIFEKYRQKLLVFIKDRVSEEKDAEDILQDVFLRLIQTAETDSIIQISGWLYRVARNQIIDSKRKYREERLFRTDSLQEDSIFIREVTEILIDDKQSPEKEYFRNLVWEELNRALKELPKKQRYAFEQTELNGISFKTLSSESGISVKTLLSQKHYAVKYLRKQLKEIYEELLYNE